MSLTNDSANATLQVEGEPLVHGPTIAALHAAIDRMKPAGPSFVIVDNPSGDYAQAGGGNGEFSVEWREYGEPFVHLVAGKGTPVEEAYGVRMSAGYANVFRHEILTIDDAKLILEAFLRDGRRPKGYVWRDVTQQFIPNAGSNGEIGEIGR